jgi:hypothetical protein
MLDPMCEFSTGEIPLNKDQLFVERRPPGDYAVRRPNSQRASDVLPTQADAIERARELNPDTPPLVEDPVHVARQAGSVAKAVNRHWLRAPR